MKRTMHTMIWAPRIVAILYAAFLLLFSFDVFSENGDVQTGTKILAFLMHSIPTMIVLILMLVSWRRPAFGALLFGIAAITATLVFNTYRSIINFAVISGPLILVMILYIIAAFKQNDVTYDDYKKIKK